MSVICQECRSEGTPREFSQITSKHLVSAHPEIYQDLKTALGEYKERWPDTPIAGKKERKQPIDDMKEVLAAITKDVVRQKLERYSNNPQDLAQEKAIELLLKLEAMEPYFMETKQRGQLIGLLKGQQAIVKEFLASRANVPKSKGQPLTREDMEELTDIAGRIGDEMDRQDIKTIDPKFLEYIERGVPIEGEEKEE